MIVLLTDFGQSEYVGVMKGVIYRAHPEARIVDLCHTIRPQCLVEASCVLRNNYRYFPPGTTFCCVVDPGVGGARRAIVVRIDDYFFVAPDNGLLWDTLKDREILAIRQVPIPAGASRTFHGRDVFAGAAAETDLGRFDAIGPVIDSIEKLELHLRGREGTVVRIDHFGNIVTNLPPLDKTDYVVTIDEQERTMRHYPTYEAAPEDELFLITGSCNTLEISVRIASAVERLALTPGDRLTIT
jgi:S-adenosylmethionine hydrolase